MQNPFYFRFGEDGLQLFDETLVAISRDVGKAKAEGAALRHDGRARRPRGVRSSRNLKMFYVSEHAIRYSRVRQRSFRF